MKLGAFKIDGVPVSELETYDVSTLGGNPPYKVANILTSDYQDISTIDNFDTYGVELIGSSRAFKDWKCLQREIKALIMEAVDDDLGANWNQLTANQQLIACRYIYSEVPFDNLSATIPDYDERTQVALDFDSNCRQARGANGRTQIIRVYLLEKIGTANALEVFYDAVKDGLLELYEGGIEGTVEDGNLGINDFILARGGTFYSTDGLKARNYPVIDGSGDTLEDVADTLANIVTNGYY